MSQKTVTVHGVIYDQRTGKPLRIERGHALTQPHTAGAVHAPLQKSRTLHRKYVRQPTPTVLTSQKGPGEPAGHAQVIMRKRPSHLPGATHPAVHHITAKAPDLPARPASISMDIRPTPHHMAKKIAARTAKPIAATVKPSHILKREAIDKATAAMPATRAKHTKATAMSRTQRVVSTASGAFALLLLGGYITYLNMPALSTRVAAAQAGISATYPAYHPSGYSLSGPVAYQKGNVTMEFAANAGPERYTLSQTKSGWDSSAVLENHVIPHVGDNYTTESINGLTIYTYGPNAAWVNDGILYTVSGDARLSTDQIERIAISM
jgi:hypothetical protein